MGIIVKIVSFNVAVIKENVLDLIFGYILLHNSAWADPEHFSKGWFVSKGKLCLPGGPSHIFDNLYFNFQGVGGGGSRPPTPSPPLDPRML